MVFAEGGMVQGMKRRRMVNRTFATPSTRPLDTCWFYVNHIWLQPGLIFQN